jgi:very-short-patch-repair endonuclease
MVKIAWDKGVTIMKLKPCLCGCGELLPIHQYPRKSGHSYSYTINKFIKGHEKRGAGGFNPEVHAPRLCLCGCGMWTKKAGGRFNRYIEGHENRGRTAWNKGRPFPASSRFKMRLARLGKEPANKVNIDLNKLHELYVDNRSTASEVSKILNVPVDAVKNRLRALGWSRPTKESCSTEEFKDRMRKIRVDILSSNKKVASPNHLEQTVYEAIDKLGIYYIKQAPLFGKFVVDAFFPQRNLILEIFGRYWHEMPKIVKKDASKKKYLEKCGYHVEEVWDYEIKKYGINAVLSNLSRKYHLS